jgi:hypothetical protein
MLAVLSSPLVEFSFVALSAKKISRILLHPEGIRDTDNQ